MMRLAEYIWLDGEQPVQQLRSKSRVVMIPENGKATLDSFPIWNFDGSSTQQASGIDSDLMLHPVRFVADPTHARTY